ncbi:MAG: Gamma-glutamyltranspeptidase @ Glutathione hydrolase [uncultured Rubrobacteraceae bacterium]|uniref:Glutathione hydrolase proenzyme n=1 Tax=uncultured Rubrobacteraceae bacterium TaxID=349277 RepID=A0A6J4R0E0_9ACTN|nr:MAG: Gamma-glutamyltranspeptidase @ Glutathione hydrolase [uncultured Rubrobacteraceae bacterium]
MHRAFAVATLTLLLAGATVGDASAVEGSQFREAVRSNGGIIASESPAASAAGLEVLDAGGNAMDAAVASTFALGVARPQSCGLGGGGFLVYRGANGEVAALDFRETAPAAVTPETFAGQGLYKTFTGHTTVGVPGTVAGMQEALDSYGTIGLTDAIAPAEKLAREGFEVPKSLSEEMGNHVSRLRLFPETAEQFLVGGEEPYPEGSILVQPRLAETLALISKQGPNAFYEGYIAESIVEEMENESSFEGDEGLMTADDLASYRAVWREPLIGDYRGREVITMPPPTSGGIAVVEMLNILEGFDLASEGQSSADTLHLLAEAQRLAFADRNEYVADPDFVDVPTEQLTDKDYAESRGAEIDPEQAAAHKAGDLNEAGQSPGEDENTEGSTTHLSVIDADGNAVALTCTIEQTFGSAVVAEDTGILLNNELTDFTGPGTANEPEPGKRPRSSISPTIVVESGEPALVVGAAGGAQIIMGSLLAIVNTVDFGLDPAQAIDAERLDAQSETKMNLEQGRVSPQALADLTARGHTIERREGEYAKLPRVQAAGTDPDTGERLAATDPRSGEPASVGQGGASQGERDSLPKTGGPPLLCLVGTPLSRWLAVCR